MLGSCSGAPGAGEQSDAASLAPLPGHWVLSEYPSISLDIDDSGDVGGSRTCTPIGSRVARDQGTGTFTFEEFTSDGISCGEAADTAFEDLQAILSGPVTAELSGGVLTLTDENGQAARFTSSAE